jgi:hypothetical protein
MNETATTPNTAAPSAAVILNLSSSSIASPSLAPTARDVNATTAQHNHVLESAEEEHSSDAVTTLLVLVALIACLLAAYRVRRHRIYYLPESTIALLVGAALGGAARLSTDDLVLFEFVSLAKKIWGHCVSYILEQFLCIYIYAFSHRLLFFNSL